MSHQSDAAIDKPQPQIPNLECLLDLIEGTADDAEQISTARVLDAIGRRSFGPVLLVTGLVTLAPVIGDIPGVPTFMGTLVFLVAVQLVFGRSHFWLPQWILKRSLARDKLCKVIHWLRPVARFLDRISRPRLTALTQGAGVYIIALACIAIAAAMPPMEFVPFSANGAGGALTLFGLALIAHDGLLALIGLVVTLGTFGAVAYHLI